MNVWVVETAYEWDNEYEVRAVFSTEEAASRFCDEFTDCNENHARYAKMEVQDK